MAQQKMVSVNRQQSIDDVFEQILRQNLRAVEEWEPVALAGEDIEGVHKVRVGLRRMRSALSVFAPVIPRAVTRALAKELRRSARELDRARDLDVYISETLSKAPEKKATKALRKIALNHRDEAYVRVSKLVQGKRYTSFKEDFTQWLDTGGWRAELSAEERRALQRRVTPFATRVLEQHRAQVLEDGKQIDRMDSEALHRLRIDCKKLRYATEFFAPLYGERMVDFTQHLKALQDLLGTLHDTAVIAELHRDLLKGTVNSKLKRMARKLEKQRGKEAEEITKTLVGRWTEFSQAPKPWTTARKQRVARLPEDAQRETV